MTVFTNSILSGLQGTTQGWLISERVAIAHRYARARQMELVADTGGSSLRSGYSF
jgi:hypothetical protein